MVLKESSCGSSLLLHCYFFIPFFLMWSFITVTPLLEDITEDKDWRMKGLLSLERTEKRRRERVNDEGVGELPEHQRWRQMELRIKESFTKAEGWLTPTNYKTPVSIQERNYDWCGAKNNRLWWKLQQRSRLCWSSRRSFITTEEQRQQQDEAGTWPRRNLSISCMLASTAR